MMIKEIVGTRVVCSKPGVGSFITIDTQALGPDKITYSIWVYLADWALTRYGDEILSSDRPDAEYRENSKLLTGIEGSFVKRVLVLPDDELHIEFSGHLVLEVWSNEAAYGANAAMIRVFHGGKFVYDIIPPLRA